MATDVLWGTRLSYRLKGEGQVNNIDFDPRTKPAHGQAAQDFIAAQALQDLKDKDGLVLSKGQADYHVLSPQPFLV